MAKVRIGFSTQFELENELVGIGTDNPTNTLQALGNIRSSDAKVVGVSTLTTFDGFTDTKLSLEGSAGSKQHTTSGEIIIEGTVTVSSGTTFTSGPENLTVTDSFTLPGISEDKPSVGTTRFNENLASLEFYTGVEWRAVNSYVDMGRMGSSTGRGVMLIKSGTQKSLNYLQASTLGNAEDFGLAFYGGYGAGGTSNGIRAVYSGGWSGSNATDIEYHTLASKGNGTDWGVDGNGWGIAGISDSIRGIIGGGGYPSPFTDAMEMHTFSTVGSKVDYGDLTVARTYIGTTGCNSPTRGTFNGGYTPTYQSVIDVKQIASDGNAVKFGDMMSAQGGTAGGGNQTRGIIAENLAPGGIGATYITIASDGNTTYFGDLVHPSRPGVNSTQTRCIFAGSGSASYNTISYVTIASTGNGIDFGDLTCSNTATPSITSDSHGGLGGF